MRRTKIVCTVGPASETDERLRGIIQAGADVLRLNFSHGTPAEHQATVRRARAIGAEVGKPVAILQDLPGPKIRIGELRDGPVRLSAGDPFSLTTADVPGDRSRVSVDYPRLADEVRPGQTLLLADGTVELQVEAVAAVEIRCRVIVGGELTGRKGVTVPRGALGLAAFTERDRELLAQGLSAGVDLVAISFVRAASDIAVARRFLHDRGADVPLMAKIEKPEAVDALDEIVAVADCLMVARGDLGIEIPFDEVPLVQKDVIAKARRAGKPVVTATQMLRSMVESPRPTRAEVADVANAVLDGSDAVMLSEESAVGAYPVEAVRVLARIAETTERRVFADKAFSESRAAQPLPASEAIGHAACLLAHEAGAAAIVCCTRTGRTAQLVAKHRPATLIVAVSPNEETVRRLMLTWGVRPAMAKEFESTDAMIEAAVEAVRETALVSRGEKVVVVGGAPSAAAGQTDFLRIVTVP